MKNVYLLIILILTITAAYFTVERDEQDQAQEIKQKREILALSSYGQVTGIKISGASIDLKKTKDENLKLFYEELQKLKVDRILNNEEVKEELLSLESPPKLKFTFENGKEVSFILGQKIAIGQQFYMLVESDKKKHWLIARFETAFPADMKDKDRLRSSIPYQKFREVLQTPESFFYSELKE